MSTKFKKAFFYALPILFWLLLWQISALIIDHSFLLPGIPETMVALWEIIASKNFLKITILTLLRVLCGLASGICLGVILAILSHKYYAVKAVVSPMVSVIKSTPVASFIVILWILMNGSMLAIFIAVLMVMPIIWQNMIDGYNSIDPQLSEVCEIFEFPAIKRFKILTFPALKKFMIPAIITSTGLAWKSEIAAEIIAYTKRSIGQQINDAKYNMETATVFAWTLIVIALSIAIENGAKLLLRRYGK